MPPPNAVRTSLTHPIAAEFAIPERVGVNGHDPFVNRCDSGDDRWLVWCPTSRVATAGRIGLAAGSTRRALVRADLTAP